MHKTSNKYCKPLYSAQYLVQACFHWRKLVEYVIYFNAKKIVMFGVSLTFEN